MTRDVERTTLDLRYEDHRMKQPGVEARLLTSIAQRGVEEPLEGVDVGSARILLNGFKRYRCAGKLGIGMVPYRSLGEDETAGIMNLLRTSNNKALSILEQARFIDELKNLNKMSVSEIAEDLCRSKGWVSMRLGLIGELGPKVREKLFAGSFPVYSYMYTLRPFMRMNGVKKSEVEQLVEALSGKGLSVRDIDYLAQGYFRGPESLREEIRRGNIALPLSRLRDAPKDPEGCNECERGLLKDLEITQKYMQRVMGKSQDPRLESRAFHVQANLLTAGIASRERAFFEAIRGLHDRSGQA